MPKSRAILTFPYVIAQELLTRSGLERTPEPMVMDEPGSVAAFHEAGTVEGPNMVTYEICARAMSRLLPEGGTVLDLGSGSGRFLAHLARHRPDVRIVGLDLSDTMIATGRRFLEEEGLGGRIRLLEADITTFAADVAGRIDVISSIWALHHLPSVEHLDACLARIAAMREETGCAVFVADFARLKNPRSFSLIASAVSGVTPALKADGVASERAAWSLDELTQALERAGLGDLHHSLASPIPLLQIHWGPASGATDDSDAGLWREVNLPRRVRMDAAFWLRSFRQLSPHGSRNGARTRRLSASRRGSTRTGTEFPWSEADDREHASRHAYHASVAAEPSSDTCVIGGVSRDVMDGGQSVKYNVVHVRLNDVVTEFDGELQISGESPIGQQLEELGFEPTVVFRDPNVSERPTGRACGDPSAARRREQRWRRNGKDGSA